MKKSSLMLLLAGILVLIGVSLIFFGVALGPPAQYFIGLIGFLTALIGPFIFVLLAVIFSFQEKEEKPIPKIGKEELKRPPWALRIIFVLGLLILFLAAIFDVRIFGLGLIISVISAFLVERDARRIGAGTLPKEKVSWPKISWFLELKPFHWAIGVLFFWIIFLPIYLLKRSEIIENVIKHRE